LENLPEEGLLVTKHGRPIARVLPITAGPKSKLITTALYPRKRGKRLIALDGETLYDRVFD
jgi:antitoxin (DNA-binding transcriptional repressor) of toxin-antitoxin stability system